jgi:hypothetical protein
MYIWNRHKFLILFILLIVGAPFIVTKFTETIMQGAQSISTEVSPCLTNNPPTVWIEKDINSRKGYAPSGVKNTELISANMITCGEINVKGIEYIVEAGDANQLLSSADFSLSIFGQIFPMKKMMEYGGDKVLISFEFDQPVNISFLGSTQKVKLLGTLPDDHSGKTSFYFKNLILENGLDSTITINKTKSTLVFIKKE